MPSSTADTDLAFPDIPSMIVWPSIGAFPLGRKVGQLCGLSAGIGKFFTLGKLMALATIPVSLVLFFWRLAPGVAKRYVLTTKRVVVQKGLGAVEADAIGLKDFDAIVVEVLPGQEFLRAGDLVFQAGGKEVLRLAGVQHPEGFRRACLRGQQAVCTVSKTIEEQAERAKVAAAGN